MCESASLHYPPHFAVTVRSFCFEPVPYFQGVYEQKPLRVIECTNAVYFFADLLLETSVGQSLSLMITWDQVCCNVWCCVCRSPAVSRSRTLSSPNRTQWRAVFCRSIFWSWRPCWTCKPYFGMIHWNPTSYINIFTKGKTANMYIQTQLLKPSQLALIFYR